MKLSDIERSLGTIGMALMHNNTLKLFICHKLAYNSDSLEEVDSLNPDDLDLKEIGNRLFLPLQTNNTLTELSLYDIIFDESSMVVLINTLEINRSLQKINYGRGNYTDFIGDNPVLDRPNLEKLMTILEDYPSLTDFPLYLPEGLGKLPAELLARVIRRNEILLELSVEIAVLDEDKSASNASACC